MPVETDYIEAPGGKPVALTKQWAPKGRINYNCVTAGIRGSRNVSSITDLGVGDFYVNFVAVMIDVNYAIGFGGDFGMLVNGAGGIFTDKARCYSFVTTSATASDREVNTAQFNGDLAP